MLYLHIGREARAYTAERTAHTHSHAYRHRHREKHMARPMIVIFSPTRYLSLTSRSKYKGYCLNRVIATDRAQKSKTIEYRLSLTYIISSYIVNVRLRHFVRSSTVTSFIYFSTLFVHSFYFRPFVLSFFFISFSSFIFFLNIGNFYLKTYVCRTPARFSTTYFE